MAPAKREIATRAELARRPHDPALDGDRCRRRRRSLPRRVTGTREGMPQLVRALKDHEHALAVVVPRKGPA